MCQVLAKPGLTVQSDSSTARSIGPRSEPFASLLRCRCRRGCLVSSSSRRCLLCIVFFSSRLLYSSSALHSRKKQGHVLCLPLVSAGVYRAGIPRKAPRYKIRIAADRCFSSIIRSCATSWSRVNKNKSRHDGDVAASDRAVFSLGICCSPKHIMIASSQAEGWGGDLLIDAAIKDLVVITALTRGNAMRAGWGKHHSKVGTRNMLTRLSKMKRDG